MAKDLCEHGQTLAEFIKTNKDDNLSMLLSSIDLMLIIEYIGAFQINALCWGILKKKKCQHWIATLTAIKQVAGEDDVRSDMALSIVHWETDIEAVEYSGRLQELMARHMKNRDIEFVEFGPN